MALYEELKKQYWRKNQISNSLVEAYASCKPQKEVEKIEEEWNECREQIQDLEKQISEIQQ